MIEVDVHLPNMILVHQDEHHTRRKSHVDDHNSNGAVVFPSLQTNEIKHLNGNANDDCHLHTDATC